MTVQEAIKYVVKEVCEDCCGSDEPMGNCKTCGVKISLECMEEVEQYRAIGLTPERIEAMQGHNVALINDLKEYQSLGTVKELKEAREKQIPKKPKDMQDDANGIDVWVTCECGAMMLINTDLHKQGYCRKCGQLMEFPQPYKKEGAENE